MFFFRQNFSKNSIWETTLLNFILSMEYIIRCFPHQGWKMKTPEWHWISQAEGSWNKIVLLQSGQPHPKQPLLNTSYFWKFSFNNAARLDLFLKDVWNWIHRLSAHFQTNECLSQYWMAAICSILYFESSYFEKQHSHFNNSNSRVQVYWISKKVQKKWYMAFKNFPGIQWEKKSDPCSPVWS